MSPVEDLIHTIAIGFDLAGDEVRNRRSPLLAQFSKVFFEFHRGCQRRVTDQLETGEAAISISDNEDIAIGVNQGRLIEPLYLRDVLRQIFHMSGFGIQEP
jgi:hypothetical protein